MTRETDQEPTNGSDNGVVQPLHVDVLLDGARLLVVGGTGFVGKVWLAMLLSEFPNVDHIFMVVRERKNKDGTVRQSSKARFWEEVAPSPVFDPLRKRYPGAAFDAFIEKKLTPIPVT